MSVTNEELQTQITKLAAQVADFTQTTNDHLVKLDDRMNEINLNGAAAALRTFGYFLQKNPEFFERAKVNEDRRQRKEIAMEYLFGWVGRLSLKHSLLGAFGLLGAGVLYEAGSAIYKIITAWLGG